MPKAKIHKAYNCPLRENNGHSLEKKCKVSINNHIEHIPHIP